jgi:myo-inositol catabolism protein IolC
LGSLPVPLFVLAMDHRAVMRRLFERPGENPAAQAARFAAGKSLIFRALERLLDADALPAKHTGVLVDEMYGAHVARAVPGRGCLLIMPVEASRPVFDSDTPELEFEYGEAFAEHLAAFPVDAIKLLVIHNMSLPEGRRRRQADRCRRVMDWAKARDVPFMLELLTPPTPEQLKTAGGTRMQFDAKMHTEVVARAIEDLRNEGVEPDIWKLEPLPGIADYESIAGLCRSGGRTAVTCVLLGGGADIDLVEQWVSDIRRVDGFSGFAIGRSLWQEPLAAYYAGTATPDVTVKSIAGRFSRLTTAFRGH